MRAVIDIGTNSVLMLIGERGLDGRVRIVDDRSTITRLGEGVARTCRLAPFAIERTLAVLREYRRIATEHRATMDVVATEGVRLAVNPRDFLEPASAVLGIGVRILSGDEEARLSYLSVACEMPEGPMRVVDIGGGSTELVLGEGLVVKGAQSHPMGSVRYTEQFVDRDPPGPIVVDAMRREALGLLKSQPVAAEPVLHGLAGTVTSVAALLLSLDRYDREQVDGSVFTRAEVATLRDALANTPLAERSRSAVLAHGRADVIVAGITILEAVMAHCGAERLVVRDRGLRYALL